MTSSKLISQSTPYAPGDKCQACGQVDCAESCFLGTGAPSAARRYHFDRHVEEVHKLLPASTVVRERDRTQFDCEGDAGIVVVATPDRLELRLPTLEWHGHEPVSSTVLWKTRRWSELKDGDLKKLITRAMQARKRQFQKCRCCEEVVPAERRHSADVCHGCAETQLGIVH